MSAETKELPIERELFAVWTRLELATSCVTGRHSNQLNYHTVRFCSANIIHLSLFHKMYATIFYAVVG